MICIDKDGTLCDREVVTSRVCLYTYLMVGIFVDMIWVDHYWIDDAVE